MLLSFHSERCDQAFSEGKILQQMEMYVEPVGVVYWSVVWLTGFASFPVYYRALVNFTDSLVYGPELDDIFSPAFSEISDSVVDTVSKVLIE